MEYKGEVQFYPDFDQYGNYYKTTYYSDQKNEVKWYINTTLGNSTSMYNFVIQTQEESEYDRDIRKCKEAIKAKPYILTRDDS